MMYRAVQERLLERQKPAEGEEMVSVGALLEMTSHSFVVERRW